MPRGPSYTNEQIMEALRACKGLVYLAAKRVGCKPDTIYARVKASPEVAACLQAQRGEIVDTGELSLYNAVLKGESWAVQFILKTLGKDRGYVERQQTQEVTDDEITREIEAELERLAARRPASAAGPAASPGGNGQAGGGAVP